MAVGNDNTPRCIVGAKFMDFQTLNLVCMLRKRWEGGKGRLNLIAIKVSVGLFWGNWEDCIPYLLGGRVLPELDLVHHYSRKKFS